jgi:hypothetical protein
MGRINQLENISIRGRYNLRPSSDTDVMIRRDLVKQNYEGNVNKEITRICKIFVKVWLKVLIKWLLEHNEYSINDDIILRIVNRDSTSKVFKYNIKTRGIDPILFVKNSPHLFKQIRRYYLAALNEDFKKLLDEQTEKGLEYISLKKTNYVDFKQ